MGSQINTNVGALNANRNLNATQSSLNKSLEKLSSGLRINRAADDAAGLSISEGLRSQISGIKVAQRNAQDAISVIQTAEGSLTEVHTILHRLRDLSVQAANDSNNADSRDAIKKEATQLQKELGRIGDSTNFNGIKLLQGGATSQLNFQVGADGDTASQIGVDLGTANVKAVASTLDFGTGTSIAFDNTATLDTLDLTTLDKTGGTAVTTLSIDLSAVKLDGGTSVDAKAADLDKVISAINGDKDFAKNYVASKNAAGGIDISSTTGGIVEASSVGGTGFTAGTEGTAGALGFGSAAAAQASTVAIDAQIDIISGARADLGASQNRFESAINSLAVSGENLTAAESRIRDTDMAAEMVNFTKNNILSQAGVSMLAQANQSGQGILKLLG